MSNANLPSKQGDINVPLYHLRPLPPTNTKNPIWIGVNSKLSVCLSVAHAALQAHLQEFLDCQDLVFETVEIVTLRQGNVKNLDFRVL